MKNIRFMHKDASKLAFDNDVFDIIFSSWILMYLTDEEVSAWGFPTHSLDEMVVVSYQSLLKGLSINRELVKMDQRRWLHCL